MNLSSRWCVMAMAALSGLACSDPVPPPAQGAFLARVQAVSPAPNGKACPAGEPFTYDVPEESQSMPVEELSGTVYKHKIIDGQDSASVRCSVSGGATHTFSGRIEYGGKALDISSGTLAANNMGTAQIVVTDTEKLSGSLTSPGAVCVVTVVTNQSGVQVKAGSMWASFTCPSIEAAPSDYCGASGFFVLENCQ